MKRLLELFLIGVASAAFTNSVLAQIQKLPIGNIDELVDHIARNTEKVQIQIVTITSGDGGISIRLLAENELSYDISKGKLGDFIRQKITETFTSAVDLNDPSRASVKYGATWVGSKPVPTPQGNPETILFFTGSNFSLEPNPSGGLRIPESAFQPDIAATIADTDLIPFYIPNVSRVILEVMDETGTVVETQDSLSHEPGFPTVSVAPDDSAFILPMKQFMGKTGRISITYENGNTQFFNLSDGNPYQAPAEFRQLSDLKVTQQGVEFYVEGNEGDVIAIESTTDLEQPWLRTQEIGTFTKSPEKKQLAYVTSPVGRAFFRARVLSKR